MTIYVVLDDSEEAEERAYDKLSDLENSIASMKVWRGLPPRRVVLDDEESLCTLPDDQVPRMEGFMLEAAGEGWDDATQLESIEDVVDFIECMRDFSKNVCVDFAVLVDDEDIGSIRQGVIGTGVLEGFLRPWARSVGIDIEG